MLYVHPDLTKTSLRLWDPSSHYSKHYIHKNLMIYYTS